MRYVVYTSALVESWEYILVPSYDRTSYDDRQHGFRRISEHILLFWVKSQKSRTFVPPLVEAETE
jgi:hypothetical protein